MDLIKMSVQWIEYIEKIMRDRKAGKISSDTYMQELHGISQIEKFANVMIKTRITEEKFKKPIVADYKALANPEEEKVECPGCQKQIKRADCLDYSGSNEFDECTGCEIGIQTKNLLLPERAK